MERGHYGYPTLRKDPFQFGYPKTSHSMGLMGYPNSRRDTNSNNQQVVIVIGDSLNAGTNGSTGSGPSPTVADTVFYWSKNSQAIKPVGSTDIFDSGTLGTPAPSCGNDYYAATGKKLIFCPTAVGNSSFFPIIAVTTGNWSTSSYLFDRMLTEARACMNAANVNMPVAVFVSLGVNDGRITDAGNGDMNTVIAAVDSFLDRIQQAFPGVPIVFEQIGHDAGYPVSLRTAQLRRKLKTASLVYPNIHLFGALTAMWPAGLYAADVLHPTQTGNNIRGSQWSRWLANSTYSKYARAIIASQFDALSVARCNLIANFIDGSLPEYLAHDYLFNFFTTIKNNCYLDWAFLNGPYDAGSTPTFVANSGLDFNGTANYFRTGYQASNYAWAMNSGNAMMAVKIKTNRTAAGTLKEVIEADNTQRIFQQAASNVAYWANDSTNSTYATDTSLQNDTEYMAARAGGSKYLYKNGLQVASATQASTGVPTVECYVGSRAANFFDGIIQWARGGAFTGSNYAQSGLQFMVDNW